MTQRLLVGRLIEQLLPLVNREDSHHLLLVAGGHFQKSEIGNILKAALAEKIMLQLETPTGLLQVESVQKDAEQIPENIDGLIAIGGGRSLDYAKALCYYKKLHPALFVAVPTTAGSGSEATSFAVLYEGTEKLSLAHPALLPSSVLLDEALLHDLPARQRAVSGLDALVQCIESLWSLRATGASRVLAWEGGSWLWKHLPGFVQHGSAELDLGALYAAYQSGSAINESRTTGVHALSYYLTANHGIDHGHAVAMLLPVFLRYNENAADEGFSAVLQLLGAKLGQEAAQNWQAYVSALGLPVHLESHSPAIIAEWLGHVNAERFANNPVPFHAEKLELLIREYCFA